MKFKISIYLLIAIVVSVQTDEDVTTKKVDTSSTISTTTTTSSSSSSDSSTKDTKEKRQLDHHQTAIHPNHHHQHQHHSRHQSSGDPIYSSSQANNFVIRAYNNGNRRPHSANHHHNQYLRESSSGPRVQQQQHSQLQQSEPTQEAAQQQYVYLPENPRGQQQILRPAHYSKQGLIRKPQAIRPVQLVQDIPQYAPHPYPLIPEDQLLKLLEEELANKGITANHQQQLEQQSQTEQKLIQTQTRKPTTQHAESQQQQSSGLGNYRQLQQQQQQGPENLEYIYLQQQQQQQQPSPGQQYYASPFLQHRPPQIATLNQQQPSLYPSPQTPLDYHRNIPNHPLAASSLEKEIEKLFAPKKPKNIYEQPQPQLRYAPQPQYQAYTNPKQQQLSPQKSYGTTPSPTEKQYSFLPSLAEFSGFKQEEAPELELPAEQKTRQYLPKPYPTRSEYVKDNLPNKQLRRPKPQIQPTSIYHLPKVQQQPPIQFYSPIQHHNHQTSQSEFVPISNPNQSKNSVMKLIEPPSLQYDKQKLSSPTLYYSHDEQQQQQQQQQSPQAQHLIASAAGHPSHSSIYVSQGIGIRSTTPQPSHQLKSYGGTDNGGEKNEIRLPPPNGKPITQEEFQALVDAGYPVQAVPIPVPVPYEKYIKDHPEYKNQLEQQQQQQQQQTAASNHHNSRTGSITYLHPIREQQNEDEFNEKNT